MLYLLVAFLFQIQLTVLQCSQNLRQKVHNGKGNTISKKHNPVKFNNKIINIRSSQNIPIYNSQTIFHNSVKCTFYLAINITGKPEKVKSKEIF